jgi:hypothetical protein
MSRPPALGLVNSTFDRLFAFGGVVLGPAPGLEAVVPGDPSGGLFGLASQFSLFSGIDALSKVVDTWGRASWNGSPH